MGRSEKSSRAVTEQGADPPACAQSPPRRTPELKAPEGLAEALRRSGWRLARVPWCAEGFVLERPGGGAPRAQLEGPGPLGLSLPHLWGHVYGQEAASMLPVEALRASAGCPEPLREGRCFQFSFTPQRCGGKRCSANSQDHL